MPEVQEAVWFERDELLDAMSAAAVSEARLWLTPTGIEVFEMLQIAELQGMDFAEAFEEAAAIHELPADDWKALDYYWARKDMINQFRAFVG